MGSTPTKNQQAAKAMPLATNAKQDSRLRAKVSAMINFNRHMTRLKPGPSSNRNEVHEFVRVTKEETEVVWKQIQNGETGNGGDSNINADKEKEDDAKTNLHESNEPHWKQRNYYGKCELCHQLAANSYPCRICNRIFHRECLQNSGKYQKGEVDMFLQQAHTYVGWSCFFCDDITNLLTEDEMCKVMEAFDRYHTKYRADDSILTWDEYLSYHSSEQKGKSGQAITHTDVDLLRHQFRLMDLDDSGFVNYYEFMTQEACLKLAVRDQQELVALLSSKEIGGARSTFATFDKDGDGSICEQDIKETYLSWYSSLSDRKSDIDMEESIKRHVESQTNIMFDDEAKKKGSLKWEEYAEKQALYIISSRPNRYTSTDYVLMQKKK